MRPIDADAMKDTNNNVIMVIDPETKRKYWISLNDYIDAQPTVDTIKHAHWKKSAFTADIIKHAHRKKSAFSDIICSSCNFSMCITNSVIPKMLYCPNCGARMDEVEQALGYADQDTMMPAT